jgi:hypothetical protein
MNFNPSDKVFAQVSLANALNVILHGTPHSFLRKEAPYPTILATQRLTSTSQTQILEVPGKTFISDVLLYLINISSSDILVKVWHIPSTKDVSDDYLLIPNLTIKANGMLVWDKGVITQLPFESGTGGLSIHGYEYQALESIPHRAEITLDDVVLYLRKNPIASQKWKLEKYNGTSEDDTSRIKYSPPSAQSLIVPVHNDGVVTDWRLYPGTGEHPWNDVLTDDGDTSYVYVPFTEESGDQLMLRLYDGENVVLSEVITGLSSSYVAKSYQWDTNPFRDAPWVKGDFSDIEIGKYHESEAKESDSYKLDTSVLATLPDDAIINWVKVWVKVKLTNPGGSRNLRNTYQYLEINYTPASVLPKYYLVRPGMDSEVSDNAFINTPGSNVVDGWFTEDLYWLIQEYNGSLIYKLKDLSTWSTPGTITCKVVFQVYKTLNVPPNITTDDIAPINDDPIETAELVLTAGGTISGNIEFEVSGAGVRYYLIVVNIYVISFSGIPSEIKVGFISEKDRFLTMYGRVLPDGVIFIEKAEGEQDQNKAKVVLENTEKVINDFDDLINKPATFPPSIHDSDKHTYDLIKQVASDPTPEEGDVWINAASNVLKIFLNSVTKVFSFVGHGKDDHDYALPKQVASDGSRVNGDNWFNTADKKHKWKQNNIVIALPNDIETVNKGISIDGSGSGVSTGIKGDLRIDFMCQVTYWAVYADVAGSIVFDIWKDTHANFPPVAGDSMIGVGNKPTLSAVAFNGAVPSGWTTITINAGDVLRFNVDTVSTVTRVNLILKLKRL